MKHLRIIAAAWLAVVGLLGVGTLFVAPTPAFAACPYTGNTSGVDSSAMLNALNDICTGSLPSSAAGAGITPVASASAEACHVLKATPGNLYGVSGYVGAAAWIMVFDATSAPVDGGVTPKVWAYVSAAGSWSIAYGTIPAVFATGITVCASSTGPLTKTTYSTNTVFSGYVQ